ncbi:uncharacterized protein LOC119685912 [Teleopsis dalmanni]|uniref:uncharacterized protein LOC119685912 n=1 Tax=Teleopsis dalmanni TaxID=139649 RepID=UPI0018CE8763|nr:uncharacterized protein LOC119685912 [Teleopsis dalmanni]XP_037956248.1 uncharacterized protein LOC119685912 [Teleopsis dalmanni]
MVDPEENSEIVDVAALAEEAIRKHFELEEQILKKLLQLERDYRDHYAMHLKEMQFQDSMLTIMSGITKEFLEANKNGPCCDITAVYADTTDDGMDEYSKCLEKLRTSCCRLMQSIKNLRTLCLEFTDLYGCLNLDTKSPFIEGDHIHKPIAYFVEVVDHIFRFFYARTLKLQVSTHQMDPERLECLAKHKILLQKNDDFNEYFNTELGYCKCLEPLLPCPHENKLNYPV